MEYHIKLPEEVEPAVRRIALKQLELAIAEAHDDEMDRHEAVHRIRKRCKKQRALLRLVRPGLAEVFQKENAFYRDLSRELSSLRDAQALLEAFDRTIEHFEGTIDPEAFGPIRAELVQQRASEAGHDHELSAITQGCAEQLRQAMARVESWKIEATGFDALQAGLVRTYRRARRAMYQVQKHADTASLHEWRKRVKYHWYHTRLLRRMSPRILRPHRLLAADLGTILGQDHDLAVLRERLTAGDSEPFDSGTLESFLTLVSVRQAQLQEEALLMGRYLLAEKPQQLADRWRHYWQAWRDEPNVACQPPRSM